MGVFAQRARATWTRLMEDRTGTVAVYLNEMTRDWSDIYAARKCNFSLQTRRDRELQSGRRRASLDVFDLSLSSTKRLSSFPIRARNLSLVARLLSEKNIEIKKKKRLKHRQWPSLYFRSFSFLFSSFTIINDNGISLATFLSHILFIIFIKRYFMHFKSGMFIRNLMIN